jgi:predicted nucleic acid-binding protein
MGTFAVDTSCMVAAVCSWHERHHAAVEAIEERLERGERVAVAAHALVETYAVLTRLPAPHRLAPQDAWTLVNANFVESAAVAALDARGHIRVLEQLAGEGIGGGRSYDAVIAACAVRAKADVLLTFNRRHFEPAPRGLVIIEPTDPT